MGIKQPKSQNKNNKITPLGFNSLEKCPIRARKSAREYVLVVGICLLSPPSLIFYLSPPPLFFWCTHKL